MEAEELDAPAQRRKPPVGEPARRGSRAGCGRPASRSAASSPTAVPPYAVSVCRAAARRTTACAGTARPRSVARSRRRTPGAPARRARSTRRSSGETPTSVLGDAELAGELAHLVAVARERERARPVERLVDRPRPGRRVAVLVAADPACRSAAAPARPAAARGSSASELGRRVEQALLEEPEPVADLVDDARPLRAHLVGLPERGHLLGDRASSAASRRSAGGAGRRARSSQPVEPQRARRGTVRRVASVGCAVSTSSSESRRPAGGQLPRARRPPRSSRANASASDSRGTRSSCSYSRRRRSRWCCSARFASWK